MQNPLTIPQLTVGQKVWIELNPTFACQRKPKLLPYRVIDADDTVAYVVHCDDVGCEDQTVTRISQKTGEIHRGFAHSGYTFTLWLSEEDYYEHIQEQAEKLKLQQEALSRIQEMTPEELREFLST